ncbi:MAG: NAD(P)/FAD-dependent oxidoreductase [Cyanobacteria bacterium P01_H01_bin.121]
MTNLATPQICILGGGFGGLYTALRLSQFTWNEAVKPTITLVDQNDRFVFLPLLYELVTGELASWEIAPTYSELLASTGVRFQQGTVSTIDLDQQQVALAAGQVLPYDRLVLAMGGETPLDLVSGAAEYSIPFRTLADASRLKQRLAELEASESDKIRITVVGGGYSGVELACKLADRLGDRGRVRVIERDSKILRTSPTFNQESSLKALSDRGIWLDLETTVESIAADQLTFTHHEQTETIPVDITLWTVGTRVIPLLDELPLPKTETQQLRLNQYLQVLEHPDIFALGDLAACQDLDGNPIPTTAQSAIQQSDYVGWNVWASLSDRPLLPFRYQHLGEMLSLGEYEATLSGLGLTLNGPLAHVARRLVYLYRMPTLEHQLRVGFNWITKPLQDLLLNAT